MEVSLTGVSAATAKLEALNGAALLNLANASAAAAPGSFDASKLSGGETIDPAQFFNANSAGWSNRRISLLRQLLRALQTYNGNFKPTAEGLVGIKLGSGNVGWIRLELTDIAFDASQLPSTADYTFAGTVRIVDWAFESCGTSIVAGATSGGDACAAVPVTSPLALLAAGALGVGAFRRRKGQKAA